MYLIREMQMTFVQMDNQSCCKRNYSIQASERCQHLLVPKHVQNMCNVSF
ncbi:hypothetical protein HanPSC8_Chr15g0654821 [Helianthus annuus]|nr:hypothetical protein HanPSC8_Chr15g0654821 [Helianthus annuus]